MFKRKLTSRSLTCSCSCSGLSIDVATCYLLTTIPNACRRCKRNKATFALGTKLSRGESLFSYFGVGGRTESRCVTYLSSDLWWWYCERQLSHCKFELKKITKWVALSKILTHTFASRPFDASCSFDGRAPTPLSDVSWSITQHECRCQRQKFGNKGIRETYTEYRKHIFHNVPLTTSSHGWTLMVGSIVYWKKGSCQNILATCWNWNSNFNNHLSRIADFEILNTPAFSSL